MTGVAVLGDPVRTSGYRLAGARLLPATTAAEVRRQWRELPADVGVVLLTPAAAEVLGPQALESAVVLTVVLPP
ncbi:ATP synthase F subunit [Kribbella orskensis]|uniref:ATP synthase F subunit n=1 Tax=Kribbella orskensis TaxID=2512216 RepID=A0ABY2B701_9ACTN|nr:MULTISPECIES: V-type ATP synthase subunit F [Kribbella]TCN29607.1 ATP synthase F subunit [Kribbella sp. VKM Ac-2500]TCO09959.1 ATP synthase F subunit [Kribbella orskensis]